MVISEKKIQELVDNLMVNKRPIEYIKFLRKKDDQYLSLKQINGHHSSFVNNEYVLNFHEHLWYANHNWLKLLVKKFECFMVQASVSDEGEIDHDELKVEAHINNSVRARDGRQNWFNFAVKELDKLVPFNQFVEKIRIYHQRYELSYIHVNMIIDKTSLRRVSNEPNHAQPEVLRDQWRGTIWHAFDSCKEYHTKHIEIPVVDGKMSFSRSQEEVRIKV